MSFPLQVSIARRRMSLSLRLRSAKVLRGTALGVRAIVKGGGRERGWD